MSTPDRSGLELPTDLDFVLFCDCAEGAVRHQHIFIQEMHVYTHKLPPVGLNILVGIMDNVVRQLVHHGEYVGAVKAKIQPYNVTGLGAIVVYVAFVSAHRTLFRIVVSIDWDRRNPVVPAHVVCNRLQIYPANNMVDADPHELTLQNIEARALGVTFRLR